MSVQGNFKDKMISVEYISNEGTLIKSIIYSYTIDIKLKQELSQS